ncbi:CAVP-target protein [Armadillidium vulgare]|nr:CAVP-target protein [Armadillidium vulgare]
MRQYTIVPEKVPVPPPAEISVIALPPPAEPPRFSHLLVDTHVMEGEPVVLKASVSGSPNPTIAWFRDGVPVLPDDTLQIYEEPDGFVKIYIPRTNLDHTGQYEVIASNCAGTAKCIGFLSIEQRLPTPEPKEPPGFTKLLEDVTVESGNSISLEAEVTGKPKPLVSYCLGSSNKGILSCAIGVSEVDLSGSLGKEIESEMKKNIILLDSDSTNSDENERAISSKPSSKCKYPGSEELTLGDTGLYISSISQHISNEDVNEVNETNLGARNNFRDIKILDHDVYKRYLDQSLKDEFILDYDQELSDSSFERLEKERENSPNNCNVTSSMSSVVPSRIIDNKKLEELWTIVQEQHKLLNASDRKQTNARDSGYYSDRYGTTCANNMNEVQYKNSSKSLKLSDSKTMESGRKVLLTLETTALSQDFVSEIEKSKCLPVPKFFDDKNKGSKIVKSGKSSHTTAETGYYYTEFLEYNHLENCSLNSKYLVDENSSIDSRGKNKPKKVKRSETIDLLHLLFDEKYEDAYISKVYLDTEPLKSELSLVPDISSKDFQIKNYYHKYFSYPRTRGKFKALEGRSCRSMTQLEVINEETISDKEESYEDKENVFSPLNSVSKSGESSYMINISPGNGNGFF